MKIKKAKHIILTLAVIASACQSDDSDLNDLIAISKEEPMEVVFVDTPLVESPDSPPDPADPAYNDFVESFTPQEVVNLTFDDEEVAVDNPSSAVSVRKSGAHVEVDITSKGVKIVLSGSSANGSLKITGQNRCQIVFDNLTLANPDGAVINNQCKKTLYIVNQAGTRNTLVSGMATVGDDDAKGCIFSEGQICFSGSGRLSVESAFRNGIASDDYVFIRPQTWLDIKSSTGHGIKANDGVRISGGTVDIQVSHNGGKGINSEDGIEIGGGRTTIINSGTTRLEQVAVSAEFPQGIDTVSCAGVKCDNMLRIYGGSLAVKCTGNDARGIKTEGDYLQTGGNVTVVALGKKDLAAPKGVKVDGNLTIDAGYLYSYSRYSDAMDVDGITVIYAYLRQKGYLVEIGQQ